MKNLKINNSKKAMDRGKSWKNPGAKLYDACMDAMYCEGEIPADHREWDARVKSGDIKFHDSFLKEAYLVAPVKDIKNSPYGRTPFSRSGCKYPHHVIKDGEMVVSLAGLRSAYITARNQGCFNPDVSKRPPYWKELTSHFNRHVKELELKPEWRHGEFYLLESTEAKIQDNFNAIYDFIYEVSEGEIDIPHEGGDVIEFMENGVQITPFDEVSHGQLKFDFRKAYDYETGHMIKIVYSLDNINVEYIGSGYYAKNHITDENQKAKELDDIRKNLKRKGNNDHASSGQKILAIVDLITNKNLKECDVVGPYCPGVAASLAELDIENLHKYYEEKGYDKRFVRHIKVGDIDTSTTFKSTKWMKNAITKQRFRGGIEINADNTTERMNAAEGLKYGRGVKLDNLKGTHFVGLQNESVDIENEESPFEEKKEEKHFKVLMSDLDPNFKNKDKLDLNSFNRRHLMKEDNKKYSKQGELIFFMRYQDPKYDDDCYIWTDKNDDYVCSVAFDSKPNPDDGYIWISGIDVAYKYRGCGLTYQILDFCVAHGVNALSVQFDNKVAIKAYEKYGFIISDKTRKAVDVEKRLYNYDMFLDDKKIKEIKKRYESMNESVLESEFGWMEKFISDSEFRESVVTGLDSIYSECKIPKDLYKWMHKNISYDHSALSDWKLKTPAEVYKQKKGNCHDQSLFELSIMKSNGYDCGQLFFIEYTDKLDTEGNAHTLTWYIDNDQYWWIENAWEGQAGIHGPFKSIDDLKDGVFEIYKNDDDINSGNMDGIRFGESSKYKPGMSLRRYVESWSIEDQKYHITSGKALDKSSNSNKSYLRCKTPEELLKWMKDIQYGWIDKSGKIQGTGDEDDEEDFYKEYRLQSPEDLAKSKIGVCWDQTELERDWFLHKWNPNDFMIVYIEIQDKQGCPTHTFLVYKGKKAYYWFEHSWGMYEGIHRYDSFKELLKDVVTKHQKFNDNTKDEVLLTFSSSKHPKYGCTCKEYMSWCHKQDDINENSKILESFSILGSYYYRTGIDFQTGGQTTICFEYNDTNDYLSQNGKVVDIIDENGNHLEEAKIYPMFSEFFFNACNTLADRIGLDAISCYSLDRFLESDDFRNKIINKQSDDFLSDLESYAIGESAGAKLFKTDSIRKGYDWLLAYKGKSINEKDDSRLQLANTGYNGLNIFSEFYDMYSSWGKQSYRLFTKPFTRLNIEFPSTTTLESVFIDNIIETSNSISYNESSDIDIVVKNGNNRKKLYEAFIEYAKDINNKNVFGVLFDKDAFKVTYPFIPNELRYFYRLANPILCVLDNKLTFFQVSEIKKINEENPDMNTHLIFAATENDMRVFNTEDKKIYLGVEEDNKLVLKDVLADTFDLFIQNMIGKGDILNGKSTKEEDEEE